MNIFGSSFKAVTASVRRRRWLLFFDTRRKFRKIRVQIQRTANRILKYATSVSARIAKGQPTGGVIRYLTDAMAKVKTRRAPRTVLRYEAQITATRAKKSIIIREALNLISATAKRAAKRHAIRLIYIRLSLYSKAIAGGRKKIAFEYWAHGPYGKAVAGGRKKMNFDYWTHGPYAYVSKKYPPDDE